MCGKLRGPTHAPCHLRTPHAPHDTRCGAARSPWVWHRSVAKRHGALVSQVRHQRPVGELPSVVLPLRLESGGAQLVQVDDSRGERLRPQPVTHSALFLALTDDGEARHDGRNGYETDTQGADKRLQARGGSSASGEAPEGKPGTFHAERPFEYRPVATPLPGPRQLLREHAFRQAIVSSGGYAANTLCTAGQWQHVLRSGHRRVITPGIFGWSFASS